MTKKKDLSELITDNKENAEELTTADKKKVPSEKDKIEKTISKLILSNKQNSEELSTAYKIIATQKKDIKKQAVDLIHANKEKEKHKADLVSAKKELAHKAKLIILNKKLNLQIEKNLQTDKALKESNEKYLEAFKSSPYSITITSTEDSKFIEVNDAFTTIFDFTKEEALINSSIGLDMWVNIEDRKWVISTLLSGSNVVGKEFLFKKKSGEIITGLFSAESINVKNEPCIISRISDITNSKKAEKTLQDIIDNNPIAIQILDKEGLTLKVNKAFLLLYGSIPPSDYSVFNDKQLIEKGFGKLIDHIKNAEVVHFPDMPYNPHDSVPAMPDITVWVRTIAFPLVDGKGKPEKFVFLHENITEKRQAEEALKESEIKYRELVENSPDAIIIYQDRKIVFANNESLRLIGAESMEDIVGKSIIGFVHPDYHALVIERMKKLQNEGTVLPLSEERFVQLDGTEIDVEVKGMSIMFVHKLAVQLIIRNITQRKQSELELIKAKEKAEESDRLKSAFLTNMSHEIRTPMNGILGFAELLKEPNLTIDEQQDYIQTMQISGARMLNTINSIVDISKIESGLIGIDIKETNLNEKIEFTYKFFKPEVEVKGLQFLFKNGLPTNEAIIKTDNEKVYGILTNLVRNAIKFTYEGSIEFGYKKKGEYLEFFVTDTGIGIPQKQQQLIFERFRQGSESHDRGYEGSGLGLSISKSYVEMLGGRIWVESEEGLGSTFYFTIPYIAVSEEKMEIESAGSAEHNEVQLKNLKILIVEDDEISYSLLSITLQKISKEVLHVITGVQAVEACRNNPDLDLVLMDIRMPKMDGNEATRQIRQFNKDVIIIAQTAYGFSGDRVKAIEAGCNDYISKPINKTLLYELIKKYVNKRELIFQKFLQPKERQE